MAYTSPSQQAREQLYRAQVERALGEINAAALGPTDLAYTAATRVLASSTGADVTLPVVTAADAGLTPASGGGTANFLRADLTWAAPAAGSTPLSGTATVTVAANRYEHSEAVTATGMTAAKKVVCSLAPTADTDENSPEMLDLVALSATPGTDTLTVALTFAEPSSGPVLVNWIAV